jgi:hypothetical protein
MKTKQPTAQRDFTRQQEEVRSDMQFQSSGPPMKTADFTRAESRTDSILSDRMEARARAFANRFKK